MMMVRAKEWESEESESDFIVIIHEYNEISPAACKRMRQLKELQRWGEREKWDENSGEGREKTPRPDYAS